MWHVPTESPEDAAHDPAALRRLYADLERHLEATRRALAAGNTLPNPVDRHPQAMRQILLDGLMDFGSLTPTKTLGPFVAARFGRLVRPSQFGTIATQERQAFARVGPKARPVWLCNGVSVDGFRPIRRLMGRSDWPLEQRMVTPTTSRVLHLGATRALCELASRAEDVAQDPEALRRLAMAHVMDLPGVRLDADHPEFAAYAQVADELLRQYGPEDLRLRTTAAAELADLPESVRLFGVAR
jgi:hypothetical protein